MSELARVNKEYEELIRGLVSKLSEYNSTEMLDGYLGPIAREYNSTLAELRLPRIQTSTAEEIDRQSLEDCTMEYQSRGDLIKVYIEINGVSHLRACIAGHQAGVQVYNGVDNSLLKRLMIDSGEWGVGGLGLNDFHRRWVAIHNPSGCTVTIYDAETMFPFKILGSVPEDLSYVEMMDMIRDNKTIMPELS